MNATTVVLLVLGAGLVGGAVYMLTRKPAAPTAVSAPEPPSFGPAWLGQLVSGVGASLPDIASAANNASGFFQGLQQRREG